MATMQFDSDFRFDMDDSFGLGSQAMPCTSTGTSFSSASSSYDPFTPTSRRSTPNELQLDFDGSFGQSHPGEMTPPSAVSNKYNMFGGNVKPDPDHISFPEVLPSTPIRKVEGMGTDYEAMMAMNLQSHAQNSLTPGGSFPMYTISPHAMGPGSFMMTPTHSMSGSEMADSSSTWSCGNDSPLSLFPQHRSLPSHNVESLDLERHSQSPIGRYYLQGPPPSPNRLRAHRKMMVHEIQRKTNELQRAQIRSSRKSGDKQEGVDVVRRAMCKCDYPGCHKAFRRNEHLKRHKQTYVLPEKHA
jgi:hypothetical protein